MQTLFTSDRMIVKGELGSFEYQDRYISLEFIFQVNGKITEYLTTISLIENKDSVFVENSREWDNIASLFWCMGYRFTEDLSYKEPQYGIINDWAKKLYHHTIWLNGISVETIKE